MTTWLSLSVLKEADSVSQPADRVRTLWKKNDKDHDPDPVHVPKRHSTVSSCVLRLQVLLSSAVTRTFMFAVEKNGAEQLRPRQGVPWEKESPHRPGEPDQHAVADQPDSDSLALSHRWHQMVSSQNSFSPNLEGRET